MAINVATFADLRDMAETLSASQKLTIANAIFINSFLHPDITEKHAVVTGVQTGDVVPIIDDAVDYKSFPFLSQTSCATNLCDLNITFSGKKWTLGLISCRYEICMKEFTPDFRTFFNENLQVLHDVDLNSQLLQYLTGKVEKNFNGAKYRVAYFAEEGFVGADAAYFNGFDGFFTQAEAGAGTKIELNQTNPTADEIYAAFTEAYNVYSESDWVSKEGVKWKMTRKLAALWVRFLNGMTDKSQYNCECFSADGLTAMRTFSIDGNLTIFGIPVDVERDLDGVITQFGFDNPYRALLTYRTNMPIATQKDENLNEFDIWYNKDTKKVIIEAEALIGSSLPTDEYIYIGAESASPSV